LLAQPFALTAQGGRQLSGYLGRTVNVGVSGWSWPSILKGRGPTLQILVPVDTLRALDLHIGRAWGLDGRHAAR